MDQGRREQIASLFEVMAELERQMANKWNFHNDLGFSKSHILLLTYLDEEGPKRPSAIAERLKVTTGGVTVLTTKLLKGGFIEKVQSEADKRSAQIHITEEGKEILEKCRKQVEKMFDDTFNMLTSEEIDTLHLIFKKMTK